VAHKTLKSQNSQNNSSISDLIKNPCSLHVYIAVYVSGLQQLALDKLYHSPEKSSLKDLKDKVLSFSFYLQSLIPERNYSSL